MTERLYYTSEATEGRAKIIRCTEEADGRYAVELDQTLFHPQGGGQPADRGYIAGRTAPIIVDGVTDMSRYVNPIPAGLVLTGIVVSVSVSAVMLSLTVRIYKTYRTLDVDKLYMMISHKKKRRDRR